MQISLSSVFRGTPHSFISKKIISFRTPVNNFLEMIVVRRSEEILGQINLHTQICLLLLQEHPFTSRHFHRRALAERSD